MKKRNRIGIILGLIVSLLSLIILINFIPTFTRETSGMTKLPANGFNLYYETEADAAYDLFALANIEFSRIANDLGVVPDGDINIYVYDKQNTMQQRKYGYITPLLGLDWYIGDNIGTDVILTSPANPGESHDYDSVKFALPHELVHAYLSSMNFEISLWLNEGIALYLTNGEPFYKEYLDYMPIPTYAQTRANNPIQFSNIGGYDFAATYVEYIVETYGWDALSGLIVNENYEANLGKSQREIYDEWVNFIENYYQ